MGLSESNPQIRWSSSLNGHCAIQMGVSPLPLPQLKRLMALCRPGNHSIRGVPLLMEIDPSKSPYVTTGSATSQ